MKTILVITAITMAAPFCSAQVELLALDSAGRLRWTNAVMDPVTPPIYQAEWACSPTGAWVALATVTNQTFLALTNPLPGAPASAYYRVAWTNGEVWQYREFDSQGLLVVTGKLYVSTEYIPGFGLASVSGTWSRSQAVAGGDRWFRVNQGKLRTTRPVVDPAAFTISLGCYGEPCFWLEGPWPVTNPWWGTWYCEGGFAYFRTNGTYLIQRLTNCQ